MQKNLKKIENNNFTEFGRIPPQAVDLEEIVLGALILETNAINEVFGILTPEIFYKDAHQKIYKAIKQIKDAGLCIDLMTVTQRLKKNKELDEVGGVFSISNLMTKIGSASNIFIHSLILHEHYLKRECIKNANEVLNLAYDESNDISDIIEKVNEFSSTLDSELKTISGNNILESEITLTQDLKIEPHLLAIKSNDKLIGIFSKGNISLFIGKAKSRKTFALTLFVAYLTGGLQSSLIWCKYSTIRIFDTEQSKFHSQKIIKRICKIIGIENHPGNLKLFAIKQYNDEERRRIIENVIKKDRPDIVVIDGVRDLMQDINDIKETSRLKDWIMMLADKYNCHIMLALHMNKADNNARGHIGSELVNKCETVLMVRKEDDEFSIIEPSETRGETFEPINMRIVSGVPEFEGFAISENGKQNMKRSTNNDETPF